MLPYLLWLAIAPASTPIPVPVTAPMIAQFGSSLDLAQRYEAQQLFGRANGKAEAGDLAGAIADYTEALRLYPAYFQALGGRAAARLKGQDYEGAIGDYQAMLKLAPNDVGVWHNLAKIAYQRQDYPLARKWASEALSRNGDLLDVRQLRARAALRLGEFRTVLEDYNAILALQPEDAATLVARGKLFHRLGNYPLAQDDYNAALRLDPKQKSVYGVRAMLRLDQGTSLGALDDCDAARKLDAATALVLYIQGNARFNFGQKALASEAYNQAAALPFGSDGEAEDFDYRARGDARFNLKLYKEALADYDAALKFNPYSAEAHLKRAEVQLALNANGEATEDLHRAQELFAQRGDQDRAARVQAKLEKLTPQSKSP